MAGGAAAATYIACDRRRLRSAWIARLGPCNIHLPHGADRTSGMQRDAQHATCNTHARTAPLRAGEGEGREGRVGGEGAVVRGGIRADPGTRGHRWATAGLGIWPNVAHGCVWVLITRGRARLESADAIRSTPPAEMVLAGKLTNGRIATRCVRGRSAGGRWWRAPGGDWHLENRRARQHIHRRRRPELFALQLRQRAQQRGRDRRRTHARTDRRPQYPVPTML